MSNKSCTLYCLNILTLKPYLGFPISTSGLTDFFIILAHEAPFRPSCRYIIFKLLHQYACGTINNCFVRYDHHAGSVLSYISKVSLWVAISFLYFNRSWNYRHEYSEDTMQNTENSNCNNELKYKSSNKIDH